MVRTPTVSLDTAAFAMPGKVENGHSDATLAMLMAPCPKPIQRRPVGPAAISFGRAAACSSLCLKQCFRMIRRRPCH